MVRGMPLFGRTKSLGFNSRPIKLAEKRARLSRFVAYANRASSPKAAKTLANTSQLQSTQPEKTITSRHLLRFAGTSGNRKPDDPRIPRENPARIRRKETVGKKLYAAGGFSTNAIRMDGSPSIGIDYGLQELEMRGKTLGKAEPKASEANAKKLKE